MSLTCVTQASGLIYAAESGSNTQITDFFDALYFGLTTLTTVGFGDITPVTPVGRLIVSASTVVGIALVAAAAYWFGRDAPQGNARS